MTVRKIILPEELKIRFRAFITGRSGIYFKDYNLKDVECAVADRMAALGIDNSLAYYTFLTSSEKKEDEFRELLNLLTVKHTYFFRNEAHFKALKERILPEIALKKAKGPKLSQDKPAIRIWSAGCSTGEEPYSIAMTVLDSVDLDRFDVEILATDASMEAIALAKRGIYGENSMRLVDKEHRDKYFIRKSASIIDKKHEISDAVKKMVRFDYLNLVEEGFPYGIDIIFCRNVFIYFELETTIKILNKFYESLNEYGRLFIGYAESLQFVSDKFKMEDYEEAILYRRLEPETIPVKAEPKTIEEKVEEVLENISAAEFEAEIAEKEIVEKKPSLTSEEINKLLEDVVKNIYTKQYGAALSMIRQAKEKTRTMAEPYYFAAEIFANQGRFNDAMDEIKHALKINPLFGPAHYLMGTIYSQEGYPDKAKESFKKAIYIDKNFSIAHLNLANIYRNEGRHADAIRGYRNTLNVLSNTMPYDIIAYSGGFNAATLMNVCRDNIERLKLGA